jgi:D-glycero-alpha-D-manno-heptose-7-phosphate kinase
MVVAILAAYRELLNLPLGEYDLSHLAYEIERIDCGLAGGKQDQYAATFGGFNFIEFYDHDRVVVNPLRIRRHIQNELQERLLLYFTGVSRSSADIITDQVRAATSPGLRDSAVSAMHTMKQLAFEMKERLLKGDINGVIDQFKDSWDAKKRMSARISTAEIETVAHAALTNGARAIKIAGAGGGGFMMIFVDPSDRAQVEHALQPFSGACHNFNFTPTGVETWRVKC